MRIKNPGASLNLALPAALFAVAIALTAAFVGMVRVKSQATEVGYRIHALRTELIQLEQQRAALEVEKSALLRPTRLAEIARRDLGLVPPDLTASVSLTSFAPLAPLSPLAPPPVAP